LSLPNNASLLQEVVSSVDAKTAEVPEIGSVGPSIPAGLLDRHVLRERLPPIDGLQTDDARLLVTETGRDPGLAMISHDSPTLEAVFGQILRHRIAILDDELRILFDKAVIQVGDCGPLRRALAHCMFFLRPSTAGCFATRTMHKS
jgi:hypothetical protein